MDSHAFPNGVVITNYQTGRFTFVLQVRRIFANRGKLKNSIVFANRSQAPNHHMGMNHRTSPDNGIGANQGPGAHMDSFTQHSGGVNNGAGINEGHKLIRFQGA